MTPKKRPRTQTPADKALDDACRMTISAIRLGHRVGRAVPTTILARNLEIAAGEYAELAAGARAEDFGGGL